MTCLRGASAAEQILKHNSDPQLRVLVVWEPILPTDWLAPSWSTLRRIPDTRAKQFWDPNHMVAKELDRIAKEKPGQLQPACCIQRGFFWDEAIVYEPQAKWKDEPKPAFMSGPVLKIAAGLENALDAFR
jgi:hypothetical protein